MFTYTTLQLALVVILALMITHKLGLNRPYYSLGHFLVKTIVDICSDKK